jgi:hypothetical protein
MKKCERCGFDCDLSFRFCPRCGEQSYQSLDVPNQGMEAFLPLLNSLYNLLAVKRGDTPHPDRCKYLPEVSEHVMARRSRIEHEADVRELFSFALMRPGADEVLMDLYTLSLSNALAGYTYRTVEEMTCNRRTPPLSQKEKDCLLRTMREECGSDLTDSEYRVLCADDGVDRRLLFCLAVRWDNRHLRYMLADDDTQRERWATVFVENIDLSEACFEGVYRNLGMLKDNQSLSQGAKEMIRGSVEQDLIHGYIVKLAESLDPL